jgi:hypothetical protein
VQGLQRQPPFAQVQAGALFSIFFSIVDSPFATR